MKASRLPSRFLPAIIFLFISLALLIFYFIRSPRLFGKPLCPDCNVILVSLDTLSANHLPCYGYNRNTAPALCEFGKENIMFDNMYANAHFTLPSHVSIFTGLLPSTHGVNSVNDSLVKNIPFLPELLHKGGYETDFVMPFHSPHLPINTVYNRGIDSITEPKEQGFIWQDGLNKLAANEKKGKKTFLFLHTYYVHSPYLIKGTKTLYTSDTDEIVNESGETFFTCSKKFISYLTDSIPSDLKEGYWADRKTEYLALYDGLMHSNDPERVCLDNGKLIYDYRFNYFYTTETINTPEKVAYLQALYDQKINELDGQLKTLFAFMSREDIKKNTILIITSDHGEEFMEHEAIQHITLYDSNVRIPLMIYIPGVGKKEVKQLAQSIDLAPTILDVIGMPYNRGKFQGNSLAGTIKTGAATDKYIVAERDFNKTKTIRDSTYKLFLKVKNNQLVPYELYNTESDPGETNNVMFNHPDVVKKLQSQLRAILSRQ